MSDLDDVTTRLPNRRTVIGAAAWSVPVIAVMTATPAFAASPTPPPLPPAPPGVTMVWNNLSVWQFNGRLIGGNFGLQLQYPGLTAMASVTLYLKDAGTVVDTLHLGPYILAAYINAVQFTFAPTLTVDKTYTVDGIASGTVSSWVDGNTARTGTWALDAMPAHAGPVTISDW